jgi:hypothetical protein
MPSRALVAFGLLAVVAIGGSFLAGWLSIRRTATGPCVSGGAVSLPELGEASGLAIGRRNPLILWSHNDSLNDTVLFAFDIAGAMRGRVRVPVNTRDWEDVSAARCATGNCLYIADIGDNAQDRPQVEIYRVPEPAVSDAQTATPERFPVVYPDGPHNAEAMFVVADDVFIITKDRTGRLFRGRIPASGDRTIGLRPMADLGIALVSDAEASPDGQVVVVRNLRAAVFYRTADLLAGTPVPYARVSLEELEEPQGEGVAFDGTMLYLSSEGRPWTLGGSFRTLHCARPGDASRVGRGETTALPQPRRSRSRATIGE